MLALLRMRAQCLSLLDFDPVRILAALIGSCVLLACTPSEQDYYQQELAKPTAEPAKTGISISGSARVGVVR